MARLTPATKIMLILFVLFSGLGIFTFISIIQDTNEPEKAESKAKVKSSGKTTPDHIATERRVDIKDAIGRDKPGENRKQMLVRMLAASEGVDKENPTEEDLSPEMQKLVHDPNPTPEKYREHLDMMKKENQNLLDRLRRDGIFVEQGHEEAKEDQYPLYMPEGFVPPGENEGE